MVRVSHILMLAVVCCMVSAAMACPPCTTADFPLPLKPCIKTKLENFVCGLFEFLISILGNDKLVVALVLIIIKLVLELFKALGYGVTNLLVIVSSCYNVAKDYDGVLTLVENILKTLGGILNTVLNAIKLILG